MQAGFFIIVVGERMTNSSNNLKSTTGKMTLSKDGWNDSLIHYSYLLPSLITAVVQINVSKL